MRVALDFDATLAHGDPPVLVRGAAECVRALKKAGHHLTLFSARSTPDGAAPFLDDEANRFWEYGEVPKRTRFQWDLFAQMRGVLKAAGLWALFDDVWTSPGKPLVDKIVDDLAEPAHWALLRAQLGA